MEGRGGQVLLGFAGFMGRLALLQVSGRRLEVSEQGSDVMTDMCFKRRCLLAAVRVDCGGSAGRKVETQWRVTAKIQTR